MTRILLTAYYAIVFIISFVCFVWVVVDPPNTKLPTREPINRRY